MFCWDFHAVDGSETIADREKRDWEREKERAKQYNEVIYHMNIIIS